MNALKRISDIYLTADEICIDDTSRIIMMSDCHRGNGDSADTYAKNQNIFFQALNYYYKKNYTYIELGDGDELWENYNFSDIIREYSDIFWLMSKFYNDDRLYFIFGNHDLVKKDDNFAKKNLYKYYNERDNIHIPLFKDIKIHEGLVLRYKKTDKKNFLIHGHQVDFINSDIWKVTRFLVRYFWRPLKSFGVNDPTSTAKNYKKRRMVAKKLIEWVKGEEQMLISGHNHRPMFPEADEPPYFNDGSCVHPRCITGIEITYGSIILIKWSIKTNDDGELYVGRDILAGPRKLEDYFK